MNFIDMIPDCILDNAKDDEIIQQVSRIKNTPNGIFYTKQKHLNFSFKGLEISDKDDYIRVKALWYYDFSKQEKIEVLPFGEFDINEIEIMGSYMYYTKITDRDDDGCFANDYVNGEIYRINLISFEDEYCCDIKPFRFHGFDMASEKYLVFHSEDLIPDVTEIVFIDIEEQKKTVIYNSWNEDSLSYSFVCDEDNTPTFIVANRDISEGDVSSSDNKLMCFEWQGFLKSLTWSDI